MTYQELLKQLQDLSPEQLNQTVTVFFEYDEYYPVVETDVTNEDDTLDAGHFILVSN